MSVFITREMLWQAADDSKRDACNGLLDRVVRSVARRYRLNKTITELSALSDLELRDIGVYRGDIRRIADACDPRDPSTTRTPNLASACL